MKGMRLKRRDRRKAGKILLTLLVVDLFFFGSVLICNPHSPCPAIGLIGSIFFYPTNVLMGILPYPWYYTPVFSRPRNQVNVIVALLGIQFLIMIAVAVSLLAATNLLRSHNARRDGGIEE